MSLILNSAGKRVVFIILAFLTLFLFLATPLTMADPGHLQGSDGKSVSRHVALPSRGLGVDDSEYETITMVAYWFYILSL
jgi:hypothetical protein